MFLSKSLKGIETAHSTEPTYNRLHDRWDSLGRVHMPGGTLKILGISSADVASYEIENYSNDIAVIISINKINI